jgi:hypothetical protein
LKLPLRSNCQSSNRSSSSFSPSRSSLILLDLSLLFKFSLIFKINYHNFFQFKLSLQSFSLSLVPFPLICFKFNRVLNCCFKIIVAKSQINYNKLNSKFMIIHLITYFKKNCHFHARTLVTSFATSFSITLRSFIALYQPCPGDFFLCLPKTANPLTQTSSSFFALFLYHF